MAHITTVNYHLWQPCNMRCRFCFAPFHDSLALVPKGHLTRPDALRTVELLAASGRFSKITFVGGEPTLCPWLPELLAAAKSAELVTMIVTNGATLSAERLALYRPHLDWVTLSVDSLDERTNTACGRATNKGPLSEAAYQALVDRIQQAGCRLKINTVVTSQNQHEDLSAFIRYAAPERWKVLQVLPVAGQNDGLVEPFLISASEFEAFLGRHASLNASTTIIAEDNDLMRGSYVMVDPAGRFFDNHTGWHSYSEPILTSGVAPALQSVYGSYDKFVARGGQYA